MAKEKLIHTHCFKCHKGISKPEGNPIKSKDGKKWLGWGCLKCFPDTKVET